ncbi:unnamed protein product [Ixodes pacificus]
MAQKLKDFLFSTKFDRESAHADCRHTSVERRCFYGTIDETTFQVAMGTFTRCNLVIGLFVLKKFWHLFEQNIGVSVMLPECG